MQSLQDKDGDVSVVITQNHKIQKQNNPNQIKAYILHYQLTYGQIPTKDVVSQALNITQDMANQYIRQIILQQQANADLLNSQKQAIAETNQLKKIIHWAQNKLKKGEHIRMQEITKSFKLKKDQAKMVRFQLIKWINLYTAKQCMDAYCCVELKKNGNVQIPQIVKLFNCTNEEAKRSINNALSSNS